MEKVSIIIPVYNGSNYLAEAINSALSQTYPYIEIIVVDDGSVDNTAEICESFGNKIIYFHKENEGTASALNFGMQQMTGKYFAWLSHDDIFLPDKIEKQLKLIKQSGNDETIAIGNYQVLNENTDSVSETHFDRYYSEETLTNSFFSLLWLETHFGSLLIPKKLIDKVGDFDIENQTAQDNDMQFRLLNNANIVFEKSPVLRFRVHSESGTSTNKSQLYIDNKKTYLKMLKSVPAVCLDKVFFDRSIIYCRVAAILYGMGGGTEYNEVLRMFSSSIKKDSLKTKLDILCENRRIILFGAGEYGRRIAFELRARNIEPTIFIDNSSKKDHLTIDGLCCVIPDKVQNIYDENSLIIITQKMYQDALSQLLNIGIKRKNIITKEYFDSFLLNAKPRLVPAFYMEEKNEVGESGT